MTIPRVHLTQLASPSPVLPAFVHIAGGVFRMGSDDPAMGEGPVEPVFVSPFWCAPTATSNAEFARFVAATGHLTTAERRAEPATWRTFATPARQSHPVVMVSWPDADAYTAWLTATTGLAFRLPTEAEWEKAARGGLDGAPYPWGDRAPEEMGANFGAHFGAMGRAALPRTVAVTDLPRNGHGIHIGGNVWEWILDWYDARVSSPELRRDPRGPADGIERCRRGGAYNNRRAFRLRVSSRNRLRPEATFRNMGFRVVCEARPAPSMVRIPGSHHGEGSASRRVPGRTTSADERSWDAAVAAAVQGHAGLRARTEAVLDVLRPSMEEDHGGVHVVRVEGDRVELELVGTCRGCPKSEMTFADLGETLRRHLPELRQVTRVCR
jgi:formylglycine-generating enzyme required for sulfatase activity/Fe-S cluster biogenesis protein NfuA